MKTLEIWGTKRLAAAVEQSNLLVKSLTCSLPRLVIVLADDSHKLLYANFAASLAFEESSGFLQDFIRMTRQGHPRAGSVSEFKQRCGGEERRYSVVSYPVLWDNTQAVAHILNMVGEADKPADTRPKRRDRDEMTGLPNRMAGIIMLNNWLDERREFVLCLANLDNLRYVNELCGREEGNNYIIYAANCLSRISEDTVVSRTGGNEFMLLLPGMTADEVQNHLDELDVKLREAMNPRPYYINVSYGMVEVGADNALRAGELLGAADDQMSEAKLRNKESRMLTM